MTFTAVARMGASIRSYAIELTLIAALVAAVAFFGYLGYGLIEPSTTEPTFSGEQALLYAARQLELGPRVTGTQGSENASDWLVDELGSLGWAVYIQPFRFGTEAIEARNIIAVRGDGPTALLATHYDTRLVADEDADPDHRSEPVPGANDGAAGTALLLEVARTLDVESTQHEICLVFFDATDNANVPGWEGHLGSRHFVAQLPALPRCAQPRFVVVVEMVGGANLQIEREESSSAPLTDALWAVAAELGFDRTFVDEGGPAVVGDHMPFLAAGVPAVLISDFDYAFRHTTEDTLDKLSAESLQRVGRVLETWLEAGASFPD